MSNGIQLINKEMRLKRRQLHSTQFLAKKSKPLNAAEPKKASIELVLPWRGLFESGWASGVVFGLVMGGCKPHGNKPTTKTSSPQQHKLNPFNSILLLAVGVRRREEELMELSRGPRKGCAPAPQPINQINQIKIKLFYFSLLMVDGCSAAHAWPVLFSNGAPLRIRPHGEEEQPS